MTAIRLPDRGPIELRVSEAEAARLVREICGPKVLPVWSPTAGAFLIARAHFAALVQALAETSSTDDVCCVACHTARSSSTECECFCDGANHGGAA